MLKIRRPLGRLIFNMGIAIPGKTVFLIETAPRARIQYKDTVLPWYGNPHYKDHFTFITIVVKTRLCDYISPIYMDVIIYPYPIANVGLINLC